MVKIIEDRDGRILNAAISLAEEDGYQWITRDRVAQMVGVSPATVSNAYGGMRGLKRAVLTAAVERELLSIVAQGLGDRHEIVMAAPAALRLKAVANLTAA